MQFAKLGITDKLLLSVEQQGYTTPTPIQEKAIPEILKRHDVMAKAKTGSGKSAAFVLPILELWKNNPSEGKPKIKVLVLTPTRELTLQVANCFETLSNTLDKKPKVVSIIGGESISEQLYSIQKGCDVVVATSGRLLDIIDRGQINLKQVEYFVLDEADKMLDLGFAEELDYILDALSYKRQNILFSATYPQKMLKIASIVTQDPVEISLEDEKDIVLNITQRAIEVNQHNRGPLLRHLIETEKFNQVLVFMANKRAADNIANKFKKHGLMAESFHGDLIQEERNSTLAKFKAKKIKILFATDIASRGLDIEDIACVVNFDLPRSAFDYTHRIGRTGRASKDGLAISFVTHEDKEHFKLIQKRCNLKLNYEQIEGFELVGEAPIKEKGQAPIKGKRKSKKDKARENKN